ncbi:CBS domain-containing protein [Candidatus Woesearchaeota archaeon]|nr:CBS domain-containing protein [Candidatus Woesearchaeota archaeon]
MKHIKSNISEIRKSILVKDIMTTKVFSLAKECTADAAVNIMAKKKISTILVCDKNNPIGIVTERDIISKLLFMNKDKNKTKLLDIMSKHLVTINPESSILKASSAMKSKKVRKLVVVDSENRLLGILSQTDIIRSMNRINENYRHLLWNPWFSALLFLAITALFILNWLIFRK